MIAERELLTVSDDEAHAERLMDARFYLAMFNHADRLGWTDAAAEYRNEAARLVLEAWGAEGA